MKYFWFVVAAALVAVLAVRLLPMTPARWLANPFDGARTGRPNDVLALPPGFAGADLQTPVLAMTVPALSQRIIDIALAEPRTTLIGGDAATGEMTFVQRSRLMGYPDAISVKVIAVDGGAAAGIWSRSRFGYGDSGVNKARVRRWLAKLQG